MLHDDFDNRLPELLEMGVARHSTANNATATIATLQAKTGARHCIVQYPDSIAEFSVDEMWTDILTPSDSPSLNRILSVLHRCNRDLVWKSLMSSELRRIAAREREFKERMDMVVALHAWRSKERPAKLERLYEVRELFEKRLEAAQGKLRGLRDLREGKTNRGEGGKGEAGGVEDSEFHKKMMRELRLQEMEEEEEEEEEEGCVTASYEQQEQKRLKAIAKHKKAMLRMKQETDFANVQAREDAEARARSLTLLKEKERDDKSKGEEEKLCEVLVSQVKKRMEKVEELLEGLQEQEWEEEDEEYEVRQIE